MEGAPWDDISDLAKDLVKSLINVDPNKRLSSCESMNHGWFHNDLDVPNQRLVIFKK